MQLLLQLVFDGLVLGCVYSVAAVGFAIIYNTSRIFHVGFGTSYLVAAYTCFWLLAHWQVPLFLSVIAAIGVAAATGVLFELLIYRPLRLRGASLLVMLISSLGVYVVSVNLVSMFFGAETKILLAESAKAFRCGPLLIASTQMPQLFVAMLLLVVIAFATRNSRAGRALRAARDNPVLLEATGTDLDRLYLVLFALGSALAGLAAVLTSLDSGIDPNIGMPALLTAAAALILGGIGTFVGPVLGGILIGLLQGLALWQLSSRWTDAVTFCVLILFLLVRPQGVLGVVRRVEEVAD